MREPTVARDRERGLTGVIDTLSAGYQTVNRHPWILAIPVLLDLFFWLGPHLSLAPLIQRVFGPDQVLPALPADVLQSYQDQREGFLQAGQGFNLFSLLVVHFPGIPSLMAAREGLGSTLTVGDPWTALGLFLLLPAVGIALAYLYYVAVARPVRGSAEMPRSMLLRSFRIWWRLVALLLLAVGAGLLLSVPAGVLIVIGGGLEGSVMGFVGAFLWVMLLWILFYLFFVVDAIVISDAGPIQAMRNSVAVVRFQAGSALGLIVLTWVINLGMPILWDALAQNPLGIVAGILGNAYIATGLAAASLIYYRDRFAALNR